MLSMGFLSPNAHQAFVATPRSANLQINARLKSTSYALTPKIVRSDDGQSAVYVLVLKWRWPLGGSHEIVVCTEKFIHIDLPKESPNNQSLNRLGKTKSSASGATAGWMEGSGVVLMGAFSLCRSTMRS